MNKSRLAAGVPLVASLALVLAACGGGGSTISVAEQPAAAAPAAAAPAAAAPAADAPAAPAAAPAAPAAADAATAAVPAAAAAPAAAGETRAAAPAKSTTKAVKSAKAPAVAKAVKGAVDSNGNPTSSTESAAVQAANQKVYDEKNGATDVGVTKTSILLGSINMHGMALGNIFVTPQIHALNATMASINDRGGVLGRRMSAIDCDDGPGEVSRAKACLKKMVGVDHIFSLITGIDWATASIHDDLAEYKLPFVGAWAYSQTEWQDPYMFPTHMSMIHEAMAGAHWVANVVHPATYGLICLTSPEMQLACNAVSKIMDASGSKNVKRVDVSISETSMSAYVLAMRAANPDHIIHYVINPSTIAKFIVESAQQGYYPPKGLSGNHLAAEVIGSVLGKWPTGRYWTNTTYKLWGPEYMATMQKYAPGIRGENHHITQAGYVAINIFAAAAKQVGPNLTRPRLMAALTNGLVWNSDASLDQRWSWAPSERTGDHWSQNYGQGREFMYKYMTTNTVSNPDGTPNGFTPDPNQFVLHTNS
jgi:hypothetical protein